MNDGSKYGNVEQRPGPHDIQQKIPIFVENERSIESLISDRIDWIDQTTVRDIITYVDVSGITIANFHGNWGIKSGHGSVFAVI